MQNLKLRGPLALFAADAKKIKSNDSELYNVLQYTVALEYFLNRGSHTFSNEPNFFKNEKVVKEKGSQWGVLAHEGGVTPLFDVVSVENEN